MIIRQLRARRSAVPIISRKARGRPFATERSNPWGNTSNIPSADLDPDAASLRTLFNETVEETTGLEQELQAHESSHLLSEGDNKSADSPTGLVATSSQTSSSRQVPSPNSPFPPAPAKTLGQWHIKKENLAKARNIGSEVMPLYDPKTLISRPPAPHEVTLPMLMASQSHLGHSTSLWNPRNSGYIFGIREGIHIISLDITASYLRRAAKIVTEIARRGGVILFIGTRAGQEEIVVNAARSAGAYHVFDRWVPGSLTNGQQILGHCQHKVVDILDRELPHFNEKLRRANNFPVLKPDLLVCLNPLENEVCLHECGLYNVPTIGIIDTDADPSWVTYPIPANDDSLRCITLLAGVLGNAGKEGQKMRMKQASKGQATYSTKKVEDYLRGIEQLEEAEADASPSHGAAQPSAGNADKV